MDLSLLQKLNYSQISCQDLNNLLKVCDLNSVVKDQKKNNQYNKDDNINADKSYQLVFGMNKLI